MQEIFSGAHRRFANLESRRPWEARRLFSKAVAQEIGGIERLDNQFEDRFARAIGLELKTPEEAYGTAGYLPSGDVVQKAADLASRGDVVEAIQAYTYLREAAFSLVAIWTEGLT